MANKKCPKGTSLVKSFKKKSGSKVKSYCRQSQPKYKTSRKRSIKKTKNVKKSKSHSKPKPKKKSTPKTRDKSKPKSPVAVRSRSRSRSKFKDMTVEQKVETLKRKLDEISGVKILNKTDIQKIVKEYSNNLYTCLDGNFEFSKFIGRGVNGSVYMTCAKNADPNNCRIIKIQEIANKELIENEIKMQNKFYSKKLAPKLHKTCKFKKGRKQTAWKDNSKKYGL
jgi:type III secretory pathway component EscV